MAIAIVAFDLIERREPLGRESIGELRELFSDIDKLSMNEARQTSELVERSRSVLGPQPLDGAGHKCDRAQGGVGRNRRGGATVGLPPISVTWTARLGEERA